MPNGWRPSPCSAPAGSPPWLGAGSPAGGVLGTATSRVHVPRAGGQGPGDEVTGVFWPSGGSGGALPRAGGQGPGDEVTGVFWPSGGSGGALPRAGGQGPGDEVTGVFWPSGGSGGALPRAGTARPSTPTAISSHLVPRPST